MSDSSIQHDSTNRAGERAVYSHPIPALRRFDAALTAIGLGLIGVACAGVLLLIPAMPVFLPLWLGIAVFSALLAIPLAMHTVSHPEITLTPDGLIVRPMLWREKFIPYSALKGLTRHPLIRDPGASPGVDRLLWGRYHPPREGIAVVVGRDAGLSPLYRLFGSVAGVRGPAFGLSSTTHAQYAELRARLSAVCGDWTG
jgi:hypothetical protein